MSMFAAASDHPFPLFSPVSGNAAEGLLYIGLMSGTSVDGVDGVLVRIANGAGLNARDDCGYHLTTLASHYLPFDPPLRQALLALQASGPDEIHREAMAANALAAVYADVVATLLKTSGTDAAAVQAIGAHGQTVRHRPELGYTRQINAPALLAELTGIDVIADFRSRDVAAGGLGAPLAPAFHEAVFAQAGQVRVLLNAGGIANITVLDGKQTRSQTAGQDSDDAGSVQPVPGFDTGPANVLMDAWVMRHHGQRYDADGAWARTGKVLPLLLQRLLDEPYFSLPAPKATGRDLFNESWLDAVLAQDDIQKLAPGAADVQATLLALTAQSVCLAIARSAPDAAELYVCGGGACNAALLEALRHYATEAGLRLTVQTTAALGMVPEQVEALAFAWLASRFTDRRPGNLTSVTGARHQAVLGALYPA